MSSVSYDNGLSIPSYPVGFYKEKKTRAPDIFLLLREVLALRIEPFIVCMSWITDLYTTGYCYIAFTAYCIPDLTNNYLEYTHKSVILYVARVDSLLVSFTKDDALVAVLKAYAGLLHLSDTVNLLLHIFNTPKYESSGHKSINLTANVV